MNIDFDLLWNYFLFIDGNKLNKFLFFMVFGNKFEWFFINLF